MAPATQPRIDELRGAASWRGRARAFLRAGRARARAPLGSPRDVAVQWMRPIPRRGEAGSLEKPRELLARGEGDRGQREILLEMRGGLHSDQGRRDARGRARELKRALG